MGKDRINKQMLTAGMPLTNAVQVRVGPGSKTDV